MNQPSNELRIVIPTTSMPTVEVQMDSLVNKDSFFSNLIQELYPKIAESPKTTCTIYGLMTDSINFGPQTRSLFLGIAGNKDMLSKVHNYVQGCGICRYSDNITAQQSTAMIHIQDGKMYSFSNGATWEPVRLSELSW
jgi:hypothetical protein